MTSSANIILLVIGLSVAIGMINVVEGSLPFQFSKKDHTPSVYDEPIKRALDESECQSARGARIMRSRCGYPTLTGCTSSNRTRGCVKELSMTCTRDADVQAWDVVDLCSASCWTAFQLYRWVSKVPEQLITRLELQATAISDDGSTIDSDHWTFGQWSQIGVYHGQFLKNQTLNIRGFVLAAFVHVC